MAVARTPLLLGLFAFAYRDVPDQARRLTHLDRGELRDAIFSQYIERSYQHEAQRYYVVGSDPPQTLETIKRVLGFVAINNAGALAVDIPSGSKTMKRRLSTTSFYGAR